MSILKEIYEYKIDFVSKQKKLHTQSEILNKLNEYDRNKYAVFSQKMFMYKLNFLNLKENNWHGSKICLKKNFKSPQWLRDLKFKEYPFWRIDKIRNLFFQNIENNSDKLISSS